MTAYTIDNAPVEVLRREFKQLMKTHQEGKDDRELGWWIRKNAAEVTLRTPMGDVLTGSGPDMLAKVQQFTRAQNKHDDWRAA